MTPWYLAFMACIFWLWAFSVPRDRNALRILLIASLASVSVVQFVTHQITEIWKLVIPGAVEVLTIVSLLQWARTRTGYMNAAVLCIAWLAHLICYVDLAMETDFVYSRYETILQIVAVAQILSCYETIAHSFVAVSAWLRTVSSRRVDGVYPSRLFSGLLHEEAAKIPKASGGTKKNGS